MASLAMNTPSLTPKLTLKLSTEALRPVLEVENGKVRGRGRVDSFSVDDSADEEDSEEPDSLFPKRPKKEISGGDGGASRKRDQQGKIKSSSLPGWMQAPPVAAPAIPPVIPGPLKKKKLKKLALTDGPEEDDGGDYASADELLEIGYCAQPASMFSFWLDVIDPYFTPLGEQDLLFLAEKSVCNEALLQIPPKGMFYAQAWLEADNAEEDDSAKKAATRNPPVKLSKSRSVGNDDSGGLTSLDSPDPAPGGDDLNLQLEPELQQPSFLQRVMAALVEENILLPGPSDDALQPNFSPAPKFPPTGGAPPPTNNQPAPLNIADISLEDRVRLELCSLGLIDEEEELPKTENMEDDELCTEARALHQRLKEALQQSNAARSSLLPVCQALAPQDEVVAKIVEANKALERESLRRLSCLRKDPKSTLRLEAVQFALAQRAHLLDTLTETLAKHPQAPSDPAQLQLWIRQHQLTNTWVYDEDSPLFVAAPPPPPPTREIPLIEGGGSSTGLLNGTPMATSPAPSSPSPMAPPAAAAVSAQHHARLTNSHSMAAPTSPLGPGGGAGPAGIPANLSQQQQQLLMQNLDAVRAQFSTAQAQAHQNALARSIQQSMMQQSQQYRTLATPSQPS